MKTQLSSEQMKTLVQFIQKRGFNEVDVQLEILDHFVCKVEDFLLRAQV